MFHFIPGLILLVNLLQAVQGEPWLIGPCRSFERLKENDSEWFKNITVSECLERCQNKEKSVRFEIALWHHTQTCWCVPRNATISVWNLLNRHCRDKRGSELVYHAEPRHYSFVLLIHGPEIEKLYLEATVENANSSMMNITFHGQCHVKQFYRNHRQ
ncbi:uncharacterized protein LOC129987513 [Argiope bruennichi]|uniref:uncharacterized protein LOC129987513 n=1 Tax=Argiope bruennichi TaxID=94029 RepID=UPI002493F3E8|nr:uncharacterized protein LOC129987513 [Argiope bruennichi]